MSPLQWGDTMIRQFIYEIDETSNNQTVSHFLKNLGYSSNIITHLKKTPTGIMLNNKWAYTRDSLQIGDILEINLIEDKPSHNIVPSSLPLNIVYEDEDLLVINKPSGMPIHPSQGNYDNTLANAIAYYYHMQNIPYTYRCITRLDRDTPGLLILAKHMYSASLLSKMVQNREIHREYLAIACGQTPSSGVITAPIGRVDGSTIERQVDEINGEYACTHFETLEYKNGYSLVSLKLETGRTHQIRVHMKYIGHPLPGDFLYHPEYTGIKRQALHSHRLTFRHPIQNHVLTFSAELPEDMKNLLR